MTFQFDVAQNCFYASLEIGYSAWKQNIVQNKREKQRQPDGIVPITGKIIYIVGENCDTTCFFI